MCHRNFLMHPIPDAAIQVPVQVSLARLGAGFGSALADIFQTESLRILAERISQWGIDTRH